MQRFAALLLWTASAAMAGDKVETLFASASSKDQRSRAPFALIATQRTGSRWIMETFDEQMCDVYPMQTEIFADRIWCVDRSNEHDRLSSCKRNKTLMREGLSVIYDAEAPVSPELNATSNRISREVSKIRMRDHPNAYGIKWMTNQGLDEQWPFFLELAKARGIKLLFLHRRDYLRMIISRIHMSDAKLDAHPHHEESVEKIRNTLVVLPTGKELIKLLDSTKEKFGKMNEYREQAERAGVVAKNLVYEDMNPEKFTNTWRWLVKDLNLTMSPCDETTLLPLNESKSIAIHTAPLRTYVRNWEEVARTLRKTPYRRFIEDVPGRRRLNRRRRK